LHDTIVNLIAASSEAAMVDKPGGVFLRRAEQIAEEDRVLLQAVARVVLVDQCRDATGAVERRKRAQAPIATLKRVERRNQVRCQWRYSNRTVVGRKPPRRKCQSTIWLSITPRWFTHDGREYIMILKSGENTPAPWVNVHRQPTVWNGRVGERRRLYVGGEQSRLSSDALEQ